MDVALSVLVAPLGIAIGVWVALRRHMRKMSALITFISMLLLATCVHWGMQTASERLPLNVLGSSVETSLHVFGAFIRAAAFGFISAFLYLLTKSRLARILILTPALLLAILWFVVKGVMIITLWDSYVYHQLPQSVRAAVVSLEQFYANHERVPNKEEFVRLQGGCTYADVYSNVSSNIGVIVPSDQYAVVLLVGPNTKIKKVVRVSSRLNSKRNIAGLLRRPSFKPKFSADERLEGKESADGYSIQADTNTVSERDMQGSRSPEHCQDVTIKERESILSIALRYSISPTAIRQANGWPETTDTVNAGTVIKLPVCRSE